MESAALRRDGLDVHDGTAFPRAVTARDGLRAETSTALLHRVPESAPARFDAPAPGAGARSLRLLLSIVDMGGVTGAWLVALAGPRSAGQPHPVLLMVAACAVTALVALRSFGLYQSRVTSARALETSRLAKVSVLSGVPVLLIQAGAHHLRFAQLAMGTVITFLALVTFRSVVDSWFRHVRRSGRHCRPEIIIGMNQEAEELCQLFIDHPDLGHRIVGAVGDRPSRPFCDGAVPWLGPIEDAVWAATATGATGAFVVPSGVDPTVRRQVLEALCFNGLHVHLTTGIYGVASHRVKTAPIAHEAMLYLEDWAPSRFQRIVKRTTDVMVSTVVLVLASPVLAVCALAVKLSSPGPILFRQERVGLKGKTFKLYKLRTMVADAEQRKAALVEGNQRNGPLFKLDRDPRVTRIGKFLRLSSIDELPQLLNVLKGEMSLVGPRPALPEEVALFDDALLERHLVKPGITGLWQVEARENPAFGPYRRLDLFYAQNWSISLDVVILILTVQVVATRIVLKTLRLGAHDGGVLD